MNEPKQMMLDLQKNETKGSEFYPNVSFMSTDNFEREKPLIKAPSALFKRHERRKKLRRDIYQKTKKQDTNKRYIKNLSNLELTQAQMNLLVKGAQI